MYEFDKFEDFVQRPRNILPYAVLKFKKRPKVTVPKRIPKIRSVPVITSVSSLKPATAAPTPKVIQKPTATKPRVEAPSEKFDETSIQQIRLVSVEPDKEPDIAPPKVNQINVERNLIRPERDPRLEKTRDPRLLKKTIEQPQVETAVIESPQVRSEEIPSETVNAPEELPEAPMDYEITDDESSASELVETDAEEENLDINARLERLFNAPQMLKLWQKEFMGSDGEDKDDNGKKKEHPCDNNIPKWRLVYEYTGTLNVKFRSEKKLQIKLDDIRNTKMRFLDEEKTTINVKESTNDLIIRYKSKKNPRAENATLLALNEDEYLGQQMQRNRADVFTQEQKIGVAKILEIWKLLEGKKSSEKSLFSSDDEL